MKPTLMLDQTDLIVEPVLRTAFAKTVEAWLPPLRHLPPPVRFRASGAFRAWLSVFDKLPSTAAARQALADASLAPQSARIALMRALEPHIMVSGRSHEVVALMVQSMLTASSDMLAFWLRPNALYEPTLPLGSLLGGTDISQDLPLHLLQPPARTLCIVPPWQQRHHCANVGAIMVFTHNATPTQRPAERTLTLLAQRATPEGLDVNELALPVKDENTTLADALARTADTARGDPAPRELMDGEIDACVADWTQVLDYTVKVLLYLNLEDAVLREHRPYTAAPKEFPGLGRRKREARLAELEQLYDRYIVGPASASAWAGEHASQLGAHGQLSAHWRRGHFRLQSHGPRMSMRKVMFIAPTVVRADRLPTDCAA